MCLRAKLNPSLHKTAYKYEVKSENTLDLINGQHLNSCYCFVDMAGSNKEL